MPVDAQPAPSQSIPPPTQQPIPPSHPVPPAPKKNIGVVFGAILILAAGIVVVVRLFLPNTTLLSGIHIPGLTQSPTPTLTPKQIPSPTPDPTANWKTYTNTLSMYSFKYPINWEVTDLTKGQQIEVYYQPDKTKSVGELLIEKINTKPGDIKLYENEKKIGNQTAFCKSDPTSVKTWCYLELTQNNRISILIVKDNSPEYNQKIDQILSTFKFTDQSATQDTTNWKAYDDSSVGFQLYYPAEWGVFTKTQENGYRFIVIAPQVTIDTLQQRINSPAGPGKENVITISFSNSPSLFGTMENWRTVQSKNTIIGGKQAMRYDVKVTESLPGVTKGDEILSTEIPLNGIFMVVELLDPQFSQIYNKIISSLTFNR